MKKIIYLLSLLTLLSACNNKTSSQDKQKNAVFAYIDCSLAYLIDGELHFHNFERDEKLRDRYFSNARKGSVSFWCKIRKNGENSQEITNIPQQY